jgi:hypothetical protein
MPAFPFSIPTSPPDHSAYQNYLNSYQTRPAGRR